MCLKDNKHNNLYWARKYALKIFVLGQYLSQLKLTGFLELCKRSRKTVCFSELIFSRQLEAIVYLSWCS